MTPSPDTHRDAVVMDATYGTKSSDALKIDVPGAVVRLRSQPDDEQVHVHGFVPDCDPDRAHEAFDRRGISTHQGADQLHIFSGDSFTDAAGWRWHRTQAVPIHLHVHLPQTMGVQAHLPGGRLQASGLMGPLSVNVPGGSVEATEVKGALTVRGSGASLTLSDCSCSAIDLQWKTGTVTLDRVKAESLDLHSVAASTTLQTVHGDADLSVQGAPLTLRDVEGPCNARVHGGALTYRGTPVFDLNLTAIGRPLETHLPPSSAGTLLLAGSPVSLDDAFAFDGERTASQIEGRLGNGGPTLRFQAIRAAAHCHTQ